MQYPSMSALEGNMQLAARRAAVSSEPDAGVKTKGSGPELDQSFVEELRSALGDIRAEWPAGIKNDKERNAFEGRAARIVHQIMPSDAEMLCDPEFWTWLAIVCFPELVEWRYGNPDGGTKPANYGIGSRTDNFLYRLWLRAELTLDDSNEDRYHLAEAGQIDFYRSHLFRQGYANARNFARALLRYQYPNKDRAAPRLKILQIRDLVKRLCRMRSNLFLEILPEEECREVIVAEAKVLAFE
jgi:hypothetical protein